MAFVVGRREKSGLNEAQNSKHKQKCLKISSWLKSFCSRFELVELLKEVSNKTGSLFDGAACTSSVL